jgi:hypothetical protein
MIPAPKRRHPGNILPALLLLGLGAGIGLRERVSLGRESAPAAAAWANIGGCGSSGGGAAAGAGKWVGRGVSGGLVDLEILSNKTLGGDYLYSALAGTTTFHWPSHPNWTAALALAWKSNTFEYEGYKVAEDLTSRMERTTGGFGDMGLSVNRLFGNENEHSVSVSALLPTGQHDIKRLHFKGQNIEPDDVRYMNPFVQPGSGLYNLGIGYEWTKTKDWGLLVFGGSYTSAWAWDNWGCRDDAAVAGKITNARLESCQAAGPSPLTWKLWELQHQPYGDQGDLDWEHSYGAPGTGATGADGISVYGYVGRKEEASTQNVGLTLSVPLAPTYYWEYGPGTNDNRVSTRIRTNDYVLKFSAGLEITNPNFPIFLSLGVPYALNQMIDRGRLVNPQNYVGTVGIKGTFF